MTDTIQEHLDSVHGEGWFKRIHHVGIAVPSLESAIQTYSQLFGAPVKRIETVADQRVRTAFFSLGESHFELLEATDDSSPIAKYLSKNRPGIHHICVEVRDIEAALKYYAELGLKLIDETPRVGAHGMMVAFIHPRTTGGVLLEIAQTDA